jgi:hypothetical protein
MRMKKDGDVGSNATSSHLAEMNSALTFQFFRSTLLKPEFADVLPSYSAPSFISNE